MVGVVTEMTSSFDESLWCLQLDAKVERGKFDAVVAGVRPVLDCIDMEVAP